MRKLLLAASALVGLAGVANAASLSPNAPNPAPGSITVTFNALVESFFFAGNDDGARRAGPAQKYQSFAIGTYSRLYPSFDGVLANGLKYGGAIEIRHKAQTTPTTADNNPNLYAQREYVYVGSDRAGRFYFGGQVPPTELFQVGNPVSFNDGGWDGDLNGFFVTGLPYYIDDANDRSAKLMYVSPQFAGFDFAASFAGNDVGNSMNAATRLSTDTGLASNAARRNVLDGAARYQGTFGAFGVKANIGGTTAAAVQPGAGDIADGAALPRKGYSLFAAGLSFTYAGFEVDGHLDTGKFGDSLGTLAEGESGTTAYIFGGSYTTGPIIVGASYYGFDSGDLKHRGAGERHGYGIAAGGTYTLAPGASIFLDYLYGHQKASGYNFVTNNVVDGVATGADPNNNTSNSQGFGIGMAFKW
jgi:hypothetical protein